MKRIFLISLFLFIFVTPAYATDIGLAAYYNFDEGNGTILHDRSGNGNDGAIYGAAWTKGINGSALEFDGTSSYVRIESSSKNSEFKEITLSAWVNVKKCPLEEAGIVTRWNQNPVVGDYYGIWYDCKYVTKTILGASHEHSQSYNVIRHNADLNKWIFVTYLISPVKGVEQLYIDGEKVNETISTEIIRKSDIPIIIGADIQTYQKNDYIRFFNGTIDEVKIYNRSLTPEEIKAEYQKYTGDGLVAYYSFNEGNGTTLHDFSGNNNNGLITGATWTTGISEGALSFDGVNDYASVPDSTSLDITDNITVEAWIYPKSIGYINPVLAKGTYAGNFAYFLAIGSNYIDDLSFQLGNVGGPGIITGNISISPNAWYHVVGTRSGNIMRTYVNGQVSYEMNVETTKIRTNSLNMDIGRYVQAGELFNGVIDELKIYSRALSAEEIKQEYEKYTKPAEPLDSDGDGLPDANETAHQLNPYSNDTDSDGIGDFEEYDLLTKYAPVFQYTPDTEYTEFYPQPVSIFLNYSDMYRFPIFKEADGPLSEEQISGYGQNYFMDFKESDFYYIIRPENIYKRAYDTLFPEYGYALYMRATASAYAGEEYIVLQYWHHYLYNDFIVNKHEGDWELAEIIINKTSLIPLYAVYSQHGDSNYRHGGQIKNWTDVPKEGSHPMAYVAKGSHASYFEAGDFSLLKWVKNMADWTSSLGRKLEYAAFNRTIILRDDPNPDTQKWMLYGGRWGRVLISNDTDILGINGPKGPRYQGKKWDSPAEWGLKYLTRKVLHEYVVARLETGTLTVKDVVGREVAFVNNTIIKHIPKAEVVSTGIMPIYILPWSSDDAQAMSIASTATTQSDYVYIIEPNGTYEFELYLANEIEARHIVFYDVSRENGTLDNVWIEGNKIYMNTTNSMKNLNVMLEYMTDAGEISANLTGISFEGDETLVIGVKDRASINETGSVIVETMKNKCKLKDICVKVISHSNSVTGLLLKLFGPDEKELVHWNNRSGKLIMKG